MIIEKFLEQNETAEVRGIASQSAPWRRAKRIGPSVQLIGHRLFPIGIAIWSAALVGACVMVMHPSAVERVVALAGPALEVASLRPLLALFAAAIAGLTGYALTRLARRNAAGESIEASIASRTARQVNTIDPARDLGSDNLDAPLEEGSLASSDWSPPEQTSEPPVENPLPDQAPPVCREMGLEEFGALPGRDAVWVREIDENTPEEPPENAPEKVQAIPQEKAQDPSDQSAAWVADVDPSPERTDSDDSPRLTAIEKLRAVPPTDLSLVQMIERFAAALHDHQDRSERSAPYAQTPQSTQIQAAEREAALAEALKALSAFSHRGFANPEVGQRGIQAVEMVSETESELRDALAKLQTLRGAA